MIVPRNPARIVAAPALSVDLIRPPAWHQQAACSDPELRVAFWEAESEFEKRGTTDQAVIRVAKTICQECPVRGLCDQEWRADEDGKALAFRTGIRAGLTPVEREKKAKAS